MVGYCTWARGTVPLCKRVREKLPSSIQGCTKRTFSGFVNMGQKNCALLSAANKQNVTFSPNFTQTGKVLLVQPCSFQRRGVMQIINVNKFLRQPARPQFRRVKRIEYREDGITQSVVRGVRLSVIWLQSENKRKRGGGEGGGGSSRGGVGVNAKC